jgi:mannose-6-phosphate isomerase-like protein (cupin superfamily)
VHTIHEDEVAYRSLPGREHKMIVGPTNFGRARSMCFGVALFPARSHAPAHVHEGAEEIIYVLSGEGFIHFDGHPEAVRPGSCAYVPPRVEHSIENSSGSPMKVAYVFSPPVAQGSYDRPT